MKELFENYIQQVVSNDTIVAQAMNYSLLAKSKRLRPVLLLALLKDLGCDPKEGLEAASSLEMVHTYSLIHDDLPAFDNDDYRRGQLTCHKAFNEEIAILAGDGLLTYAFENLMKAHYDAQTKVELAFLLAQYAGFQGMIQGQQLDMEYETKTSVGLDELIEMDNLKTSKLLTLPFLMALKIAKKEQYHEAFIQIGKKLGIAFQIQDDILDVTSNLAQLGKTTSDLSNHKTTYVSLLGLQQAQEKVRLLFNEIKEILIDLDFSATRTLQQITALINRTW